MSRNLKNPVRKYLFELLKFRAIKKKDKLVLKLKNNRTIEKQLTAYQYF